MEFFEELKEYDSIYNDIFEIPKISKNDSFICDECGKSYKYHAGLYTHKRTHNPDYIKKYSCSICNYSSDNNHLLYSHMNLHKNEENANIITNNRQLTPRPIKYKQRYSKYRELFNAEDNTFSCNICNKKYNYRQSIQVHMKIHDKERVFKFSCIKCDFTTDHKGYFKRHTNSH